MTTAAACAAVRHARRHRAGRPRITDPDTPLDLLAAGGSGYHFFEKSVPRVTLRLRSAPDPAESR